MQNEMANKHKVMNQSIVIREYGASNVLKIEENIINKPKKNELLIRHTGIGINYHDIYVRSGLYKTLKLPGIPGCEGVGVIEEMGSKVENFKVGDRIVYITSRYGAYSNYRLLDQELAVKIPKTINDGLLATNFLRAMTINMLLSNVAKVKSNQTIIVTGASGGVGRLLCQWASLIGVKVIGLVGDLNKVNDKNNFGCKHMLEYADNALIKKIMKFTEGKGVDFIFDSVGSNVFFNLIESIKICGHIVNYGQSSGSIKSFNMSLLSEKSLTISRPILFHYIKNRENYVSMCKNSFTILKNNSLFFPQFEPYSLIDAHQVHDILESRNGGGSLYLVPSIN
mgnify:FL=1